VGFPTDRFHDGNEVRLGGEGRDVEQPLELLQADGDGRAGHEANDTERTTAPSMESIFQPRKKKEKRSHSGDTDLVS
jgi:hypothetical protein